MYDLTHYTPHQLIANTIRTLAMDAVQKADSGHPGMPMGMADVAAVLWRSFLHHRPDHPQWPNRDRFVLSGGHGSMLLYALLHLSGYDLPLDQLKQFRQWGSKTPGHPENLHTVGVETTTGPLGQGLSNAVGMALAERWLAARFNRPGYPLIDHFTYVVAGDGDLMEGLSHEACALAGHWGLGKLIVFYDDNHISIDGNTHLAYSDDVPARFAAYGWHTQTIDGHDPAGIAAAIEQAQAESNHPSLIACRTHIGYGSPNRQDTAKAHGEPLGEAEIKLAKERLGWPAAEPFYVPPKVYGLLAPAGQAYAAWQQLWADYQVNYPDLAVQFEAMLAGKLPAGWEKALPTFAPAKTIATRNASGLVLDAIAPVLPNLIGGSADLTGSNKTLAKGMAAIQRGDFSGRYIHYGVREHGMGGLMNGLALSGLRPYGGTFLVFSDYMRHAMRLAALMHLPVIYVLTHDSIGLGEDGPTHQPIEHLMSLRLIPNLWLFRPADANETAMGWKVALERQDGPTALILTRHNLPILDPQTAQAAATGGYILREVANPQLILLATGSEVAIALTAQEQLAANGLAARVVSMPCWELFESQNQAYKDSVLPPTIHHRIAIEAGSRLGWERYVGPAGAIIGLDHFGASAPYETLYEKFGLTPQATVARATSLITHHS